MRFFPLLGLGASPPSRAARYAERELASEAAADLASGHYFFSAAATGAGAAVAASWDAPRRVAPMQAVYLDTQLAFARSFVRAGV